RFRVAPLNPVRKLRGSSPAKANPAFAGTSVLVPSPSATDKTLGVSLSAAAKSSSLLGCPAMADLTAEAWASGRGFTISSSEGRSGSENKTSNATAAAPFDVNANNKSRTVARDQGH